MTFRGMVLTGSLFLVAASVAWAVDGGHETARVRMIALETLVSAKTATIRTKWASLAQVDAQIADLSSSEAGSSGDVQQNADGARELLKSAVKRQALESQRLQILQSLDELYAEEGALEGELRKVRQEMQETQQVLDGHWNLVMMPSGTKGDIYLSQNGTLLTGDYRLDSGQTGSLQGTFINNHVPRMLWWSLASVPSYRPILP